MEYFHQAIGLSMLCSDPNYFFPEMFIDWLNKSELNCRPLFLVMTAGTRKRAIYLQVNVFAVVSTLMSDLGRASHQRGNDRRISTNKEE